MGGGAAVLGRRRRHWGQWPSGCGWASFMGETGPLWRRRTHLTAHLPITVLTKFINWWQENSKKNPRGRGGEFRVLALSPSSSGIWFGWAWRHNDRTEEEKKSWKNIFPTSGDSLGDKFYFTPCSFIVTSIPILCFFFCQFSHDCEILSQYRP